MECAMKYHTELQRCTAVNASQQQGVAVGPEKMRKTEGRSQGGGLGRARSQTIWSRAGLFRNLLQPTDRRGHRARRGRTNELARMAATSGMAVRSIMSNQSAHAIIRLKNTVLCLREGRRLNETAEKIPCNIQTRHLHSNKQGLVACMLA